MLLTALAGILSPLSTPVYGQGAFPSQGQRPLIGSLNHNRVGSPSAETPGAVSDRQCNEAVSRGEVLLKAGNLTAAISNFQEGLSYAPDNGLAHQRLAEAQVAAGKFEDAAVTYRTLLYKWPGKSWSNSQNGDPAVHMQFALVLLRLNQRDEALTVYQRGYQLLQSEEAPTVTTPTRGPLPPMIASTDFTAVQLEAAADTVTAIHKYDWVSQDLASADFQYALSLQPNLAVPYFYLGQIYKFKTAHAANAIAAFSKAEQLGDTEMKPFVDKALKDGTTEFTAAVKKARMAE